VVTIDLTGSKHSMFQVVYLILLDLVKAGNHAALRLLCTDRGHVIVNDDVYKVYRSPPDGTPPAAKLSIPGMSIPTVVSMVRQAAYGGVLPHNTDDDIFAFLEKIGIEKRSKTDLRPYDRAHHVKYPIEKRRRRMIAAIRTTNVKAKTQAVVREIVREEDLGGAIKYYDLSVSIERARVVEAMIESMIEELLESCCVCLDDFRRRQLQYGHAGIVEGETVMHSDGVCSECMTKLMTSIRSCPICRQELV
jgi:hypothetical protein